MIILRKAEVPGGFPACWTPAPATTGTPGTPGTPGWGRTPSWGWPPAWGTPGWGCTGPENKTLNKGKYF